jgi:hypothetical protein
MTMRTTTGGPRTLFVLSSMSVEIPDYFDPLLTAYEERYLCLVLILARASNTRVVYLTSQPVLPRLLQYFLELMPGLDAEDLRRRLTVISVGDSSRRPLTAKVLERPRLLDRLRTLVHATEQALILPFVTTHLEARLSVELGIPVYGPDPALRHLGTKSGSRQVFAAAGVAHPAGCEGVRSLADVVAAVDDVSARTGCSELMVKTDDNVSGFGNAVLSTHDQVLGGANGQTYLGCRFPADPAYAQSLVAPALAVGAAQADRGVIGRFAVDFVTAEDEDGTWHPYAVEINLRNGGTTHPMLTLQALTDGSYDVASGSLLGKHYVATDHLEDPLFARLTPDDLLDVAVEHGLGWDPETGRHRVPHGQRDRGRRRRRGHGHRQLPGGRGRAVRRREASPAQRGDVAAGERVRLNPVSVGGDRAAGNHAAALALADGHLLHRPQVVDCLAASATAVGIRHCLGWLREGFGEC